MGLRDGYTRVLRTLPDNPARKAGIFAGDIIYKVNGEEVYQLTPEQIALKVRGETGTEVTLTVVRDGKELSFTMVRETINHVSAFIDYKGDAAIITVNRFDLDTGSLVRGFAKEALEKNIKRVVLDLRDNGGGYVSAAQEMLSLWVDAGKPALMQKSLHFGNESMNVTGGSPILKDTKTIVLVNGSTASASEIVAGALQDYGKATILGEKTYGKGVMQGVYNLSGATTLKVTIASWYTPNDRSINKDGIEPDVVVERTHDDINAMRDPQLDKALAL
jgi:carboxyl-terminal processing protease